jgi:tRNA(Met) C34 N-acetyltransferase TmcA
MPCLYSGVYGMQSAALGLAIAGALSMGYANIFVTAPSPENLKTLFEFAVVGLQQMEYKVLHSYPAFSQVSR